MKVQYNKYGGRNDGVSRRSLRLNDLTLMSFQTDTTKFEILNLESGWVDAASHVDKQLSDSG